MSNIYSRPIFLWQDTHLRYSSRYFPLLHSLVFPLGVIPHLLHSITSKGSTLPCETFVRIKSLERQSSGMESFASPCPDEFGQEIEGSGVRDQVEGKRSGPPYFAGDKEFSVWGKALGVTG